MNDLTKRNGSVPGLPADFANQLASGIAESRATTVLAGGGKPLLRMGKDSIWVFGPQNDEVLPGSRWCVNIMTLAHGYCCWVDGGASGKNTLAGESMISMTQPKSAHPAPIDGTPWAEQRSFELKCIGGDDDGLEVLYKTASVGGMRGVDALLAEIQQELAEYRKLPPGSPAYVFPVVELDSESYQHPKWGKIYNPILNIVGWADTNGEMQDDAPAQVPEALAKPVPASGPAPRQRTARPAPEAPAAVAEPVSTQQAHVGQRRRPAAR